MGLTGVGSGDNAGNNTHGLCDLGHSSSLVHLDDPTGLCVLVLVVDELRGKVVLDDLCGCSEKRGEEGKGSEGLNLC